MIEKGKTRQDQTRILFEDVLLRKGYGGTYVYIIIYIEGNEMYVKDFCRLIENVFNCNLLTILF